jgi:hypothetical protein
MSSILSVIHSRWHYNFDELRFSSQDFYSKVEEYSKKRGIPDIEFSRVSFLEGGMFSIKREYLRISRNQNAFDICAAPFGNCFFVSWWLGEKQGFFARLISQIPLIGTYLAENSKPRTYYQVDTESMFKESVRSAVNEAIDEITTSKGLRGLTEIERKPTDSTK